MIAAWVGLILLAMEDGPIGLADLAEYPRALQVSNVKPVAATFRDLWDRPDLYKGRFVRVEGRLARRFTRPAVGDLPSLAEWWLQTPAGEAICAVGPSGVGNPRLGDVVRFDGRFLRRIRYASGDGDRLAPLVVGPGGPTRVVEPGGTRGDAVDWGVGLGVAALVGALLASRHLGRPARRRVIEGETPTFLD